jgi:DMSO reductase anchor subunit
MHPAYSVIFFTTASGAGYGLLFLLGLWAAFGTLPADRWLGFVALGLTLGLVSAGLLSSTAHLGRPERAWRAFSQWRSSWLSREGVLAVATFVPAGLFGIGWVFFGETGGWVAVAALLAALGAVATTGATAMIYASLKPVPQWHNWRTVPTYFLLALMSGLTLLNALQQSFAIGSPAIVSAALVATLAGWAWKLFVWRANDGLSLPATANSATGLKGGRVHSIEWPHSEKNYLLKEMGFRIARKHAQRLRLIAQALGFAAPAVLLAIVFVVGDGWAAAILSALAAAAQLAGILVERWLFFAEAQHTVTLYYRA